MLKNSNDSRLFDGYSTYSFVLFAMTLAQLCNHRYILFNTILLYKNETMFVIHNHEVDNLTTILFLSNKKNHQLIVYFDEFNWLFCYSLVISFQRVLTHMFYVRQITEECNCMDNNCRYYKKLCNWATIELDQFLVLLFYCNYFHYLFVYCFWVKCKKHHHILITLNTNYGVWWRNEYQ